ncbi:MAG: HAD hydrolase-like protein [Bacilli bacterium]|nr:HAD hydrolase-like protein [Bacilli bacterium]
MKRYTPTYYANNLFEINPMFFLRIKTNVLLLDLDNTLDTYKTKNPSKRVVNYIKQLKDLNIRPIIVSNNTSNHVKNYARALEIECITRVFKPFAHVLRKKLNDLHINPQDCLIIGDQLVTDIACGNALKIKTLLLEPLTKIEFITTRINRIFDKHIRARLRKCGKLNNWKEAL